nr:glycosyltransferase [Deltaproteobacteria bacterium]
MLSVCLIVCNEEKNLARALRSVAAVADEIVVTDTGSTDLTVEIAREYGARVSFFPWCDDFSAARNYSLDQARGDWIFSLDADEELLPESYDKVRRCIHQDHERAFFVSRQDLMDSNQPERFTTMWQLRLFRHLPDLRFRGRIHEIPGRVDLQVSTSAIVLRHYGSIRTLQREKLLRAVRLLELELKDRPGQLYYVIEYGRTLLQLQDYRAHDVLMEALSLVLPYRDAPSAPLPLVASLLEYFLLLPKRSLPSALSPRDIRDLAERWFPASAPLIWILAQQAFEHGDYDRAEDLLRHLVRMGHEQSYDQHISFDPRIVHEDALLNLGACLVRQAKLGDAQQCFEELMGGGVRIKEAAANLREINRLRKKYPAQNQKHKSGKRRR